MSLTSGEGEREVAPRVQSQRARPSQLDLRGDDSARKRCLVAQFGGGFTSSESLQLALFSAKVRFLNKC